VTFRPPALVPALEHRVFHFPEVNQHPPSRRVDNSCFSTPFQTMRCVPDIFPPLVFFFLSKHGPAWDTSFFPPNFVCFFVEVFMIKLLLASGPRMASESGFPFSVNGISSPVVICDRSKGFPYFLALGPILPVFKLYQRSGSPLFELLFFDVFPARSM